MTPKKRITTHTLKELKQRSEPITMVTCYDYTSAVLLEQSGVEVLLVGDSAANVIAGHETTLPITLDQMLYHAAAVVRGAKRPLIVVDLPFGCYQGGSDIALASAIRVMKESGAHAVKLEGGESIAESVGRIVNAGIPVMGHLGLTPQSIYNFGTYKVRATSAEEIAQIKQDALMLQEQGCFALVLEKIPASTAGEVAKLLSIPVIGIGAGAEVDGQVLVLHDLLGLTETFKPRFVKRYAELATTIREAVTLYCSEVKSRKFPQEEHSY